MKDVARLSGVSQVTVSRVVNGVANVSPATRSRVLDAMDQLGYYPNAAARALVTNRTKNIGVIGAETALFGPTSNLLAIERAADAAGYRVSVTYVRDLSKAATDEAGERFADQSVDGIILLEPVRSASSSLLSKRVPVVTLGRSTHRGLPSVSNDNVAAGRIAVEHLLDLGHDTVWHVAGPKAWNAAIDRTRGWRTALEARGRRVTATAVGDWTPRSGFEQGLDLADNADVTAVFVANDQMALGVLRAMAVSGRRVPEEVSIVGIDDMPEAEFIAPPLTTVRQNYALAAKVALNMLVDIIEGRRPRVLHIELGNTLVVRSSTAPPRTAIGRARPRSFQNARPAPRTGLSANRISKGVMQLHR